MSHRPTVGRHPHDDSERADVTVTDQTLTERFEANRRRLHAIAARMLGSSVDGWLTTITSRVCLDVLRGRKRAAARAVSADTSVVIVPSPEEDAVRRSPYEGREGPRARPVDRRRAAQPPMVM
jgi:hypothetical protein